MKKNQDTFYKSSLSRWHDYYAYVPFSEKVFLDFKENLPTYINTIIYFGCGGCRNLIPFNGKYNLIGIDQVDIVIPPKELINFTYYKMDLAIEGFTLDIDLTNSLCISHGCFMYIEQHQQINIITDLKNKGCKNFLLQEYDNEISDYPGDYYPFENFHKFEKCMYHPNNIMHTWKQITY